MTEPIKWVLVAEKRAMRKPESLGPQSPEQRFLLTGWVNDEESFLRAWPDNKRPDSDHMRSTDAASLISRANALNEAQLRSGFLHWLYVVDVDFPVHTCTPNCSTYKPKDPNV